MSAVKKIEFSEYYDTMDRVFKSIDKQIEIIKNRQKNLSVYHGYNSFKELMQEIEKKAIKHVSEETGLTPATVKERWHVFTLPIPVYSAIESDEISFSKAKHLLRINFDPENDDSITVSQELVDAIKAKVKVAELKELVDSKTTEIWNESTVVMNRIMEQHGITSNSKY